MTVGPGPGPGGGNGTIECPGDSMTLCDLKLDTSPRHVGIDEPVELTGLVVTTPTVAISEREGVVTTAGFYVQDMAIKDALSGRYSGIVVTYRPGQLAGDVPLAGDIVSISGAYDEFGAEGATKQKQIKASRVTRTGNGARIDPVVIAEAAKIGRGGEDTDAYEGVFVKVEAVKVTNLVVMINNYELFGAFEVANGLVVSGEWYQYSNPIANETFTSISGILRLGTAPFERGAHLLSPRYEADVVPQNAARVVRKIGDIQDPNAPGYTQGCKNDNGETTGKCNVAELEGVVVIASEAYVSRNLEALWVQDPTDSDGRYAGVKVVYNPSRTSNVPRAGDVIDVEGEIIEYYGGTQIQRPTFTRRGTETATIAATVVANQGDIARKNPASNAYEGMLVKIENVSVTTSCLEDDAGRDHGNWIVTGDVMIGSGFDYDYNGDLRPSDVQCLDAEMEPTGLCGCNTPSGGTSRPGDLRMEGDSFRSITGVLDFSFGDYQLQVRGDSDLVTN